MSKSSRMISQHDLHPLMWIVTSLLSSLSYTPHINRSSCFEIMYRVSSFTSLLYVKTYVVTSCFSRFERHGIVGTVTFSTRPSVRSLNIYSADMCAGGETLTVMAMAFPMPFLMNSRSERKHDLSATLLRFERTLQWWPGCDVF